MRKATPSPCAVQMHGIVKRFPGVLAVDHVDKVLYRGADVLILDEPTDTFTVVVLIVGSREAIRKRLGAPAALGVPFVREEQ